VGRDRVGCPSNVHRRAARYLDELDLPGLERTLEQFSEESLFFYETLLAREGHLHFSQEDLGDLRESCAPGYGREVSEPYAFAPRLHSSLVVAFAGTGEARLEEVVTYQSPEALGELPIAPEDLLDGRAEVVVDDAAWDPAEVGEGQNV
jgi:hypothetical protein